MKRQLISLLLMSILGAMNTEAQEWDHEYGHYIQSQKYGPLFPVCFGIPSLASAAWSCIAGDESYYPSTEHRHRWMERSASRYAKKYFEKYYGVDWKHDKYLETDNKYYTYERIYPTY